MHTVSIPANAKIEDEASFNPKVTVIYY